MFYPNRIQKARITKGIRQVDLGNRVGVSYGTMSRMENGHVVVPLPIRKKLARVLGVSESEIFPKPPQIR